MSEHLLIPFASWSVLTVNFLLLLHLTIGGVTLSAILHLSSAKWRYKVRDMAGSLFALYPLVFVLLVVLLLARTETFPWAGGHVHGNHPLNGWHNPVFLTLRELGGLAVMGWLYRRYLQLQDISERSEADWERFKFTANFVPVAHVLYGTMVAWDFEMTMLPSWESSVYGMYHIVSNFGMFLACMVLMGYVLTRRKQLVAGWSDTIFNYFGQFMLAFTILWTYLYFAQYLTIWYGNLPHERDRMDYMIGSDLGVLWWTFLVMKFFIPFCFLVFTYFRHSPSSIYRIALSILVGTWIERYVWIAGSVPVGEFDNAHIPFTAVFDVLVTVVVFAAAVALVHKSLVARGVAKPCASTTAEQGA
jgi:hypothetical protein